MGRGELEYPKSLNFLSPDVASAQIKGNVYGRRADGKCATRIDVVNNFRQDAVRCLDFDQMLSRLAAGAKGVR
jgi:hypothetical protein